MFELSILVLAVFFTLVIVTGIYSSWEYAAIMAAAITLIPLVLFTGPYIEFLKTTLFDMEVFRLTNFTALLIFDGVVIAYAFNAWIRVLFVVAFIALIAYKLGFIAPASLDFITKF